MPDEEGFVDVCRIFGGDGSTFNMTCQKHSFKSGQKFDPTAVIDLRCHQDVQVRGLLDQVVSKMGLRWPVVGVEKRYFTSRSLDGCRCRPAGTACPLALLPRQVVGLAPVIPRSWGWKMRYLTLEP